MLGNNNLCILVGNLSNDSSDKYTKCISDYIPKNADIFYFEVEKMTTAGKYFTLHVNFNQCGLLVTR